MASAGRVLLLFKGDWAAGTSYAPMDSVLYGGSTFVCKAAVSGVTTPDIDTAHWQTLAKGFNAQEISQVIDDDPNKIPSNKAVKDALDNLPTEALTVDLEGAGTEEFPVLVSADLLGGRITATDVDAKVKYTDGLSWSQIEASDSLTNKHASAQALKDAHGELSDQLVNKIIYRDIDYSLTVNGSSHSYISKNISYNGYTPISAIVKPNGLGNVLQYSVSLEGANVILFIKNWHNDSLTSVGKIRVAYIKNVN